MYLVIGLIALSTALILTGRESVHHEININASPEEVWSVLMNINSYGVWNPVMTLLEGEVKEGNKVKYQFTQSIDRKYVIDAKVKKIIPNQLLNQGGGITLILSFDHQYILQPAKNGTKLTIHEEYRGAGVNFWDPKLVELAYEQLNIALKTRVEELNSNYHERNS